MRRMKYIALAAMLAAIAFFSTARGSTPLKNSYAPPPDAPILKSEAHEPVAMSAWVAEWDLSRGLKEYERHKNTLGNLMYFAASFDADNHLRLASPIALAKRKADEAKKMAATEYNPDNADILEAAQPKAAEENIPTISYEAKSYLTIVNDRTDKNGKETEKSIEAVAEVLADDQKLHAHIEDIIRLAKGGHYDGIEIDYERFFKKDDLTPRVVKFIEKLYERTKSQGLDLRVVLEPSAPFDAGWCSGPEYVVMLYNLFGTHSGPGPKADGSFIEQTIKKMNDLPKERRAVALSTGGCLWQTPRHALIGGKKPRFIDEAEARMIQLKAGIEPERDKASATLHFSYIKGISRYTVWYADSETLNAWITLVRKSGIENVSLWRLGGCPSSGKIKN